MRGHAWILAAVASFALAAPAQAADPAQTLTGVSGSYHVPDGRIIASATLAAPPSAAQDAFLAFYVGKYESGECVGKVLMGTFTGDPDPSGSWTPIGPTPSGQPTEPRTVDGATIGLSVTSAALANQDYSCIWARTVSRADSSIEYSRITGVPLVHVVPSPPPPPPPPVPTPEPTPQPVPVPKTAKLDLTVEGVRPLARNRWLPVRVKVANVGQAVARKVTLRAKAARGAKASKRRVKIGTLKPGKTRTVKLKLRTKRKASVALTARSGRLRASKKLPLVLRGRVVKPPKGGLGGQYFTLWTADPMGPGRREAYAFVDERWAYRGIPKGGLPTCTTTTAGVDEDGDPIDGCLPYTYDAKSRSLKLGDTAATLTADGAELKVGEDSYWLTPIVKAGTKLAVSLKSIYVSGYWPYQAVTTYWLEMTADGGFALSRQTLGSFGIPGTAGSGNWASIPPDQQGKYEVLPGGKLRLTYADGKVEDRTIGIYRDAETGSADPAKDGLWLDDDPFWLDEDD